jgi:hypothetical protein
MLILTACEPERTTTLDRTHLERLTKHPNVAIIAPKALIGGALTVNGGERRMLWPDTLIDRSRWLSFWRKALRLREPTPSAAKAYLELRPGRYVLVISRDGYRDIVRTLEVGRVRQDVHIATDEVVTERTTHMD